MIHGVLQGMTTIRTTLGLSLTQLCAALEVPSATMRRWRTRERNAEALLKTPGPGKGKPLHREGLLTEIGTLSHRRHLSYGTTALYKKCAASISRREFAAMVRAARQEATREERRALRRLEWQVPNCAWAMDDVECSLRDTNGQTIYAHRLQDLASRYKFLPLTGDLSCGEGIAGHLAAQFRRYGAPLLLKRDNGGNLNHPAVTAVLEEFQVLPLNSPPYYAPYNGAIEESQGEFQRGLRDKFFSDTACPRVSLQAVAEAVENDLNHRPRPCLQGRTSCEVYFTEKNKHIFSQRERRMFYEWTTTVAGHILTRKGGNATLTGESAWRIAVEIWLQQRGYITVESMKKVLPNYAGKIAH